MLDDLHAQLRGALDQQFAALKQHYEQTIADVRRQTAADAERESAARVQAARAEWDSALSGIIETTRTEARQQADEAGRLQRRALEQQLQEQLEQTVQHAVSSVRKSTELEIEGLRRRVDEDVDAERKRGETALQAAVEAERKRGEGAVQTALDAEKARLQEAVDAAERGKRELDAERQRLQQELEAERTRARRDLAVERDRAKTELETVQQLLEAEIASAQAEAKAAHDAAAKAAVEIQAVAPPAPAAADAAASAALARVPEGLRAIDAQPSVSEILQALVQHAGAVAGRAVLFLIKGETVTPWKGAVGIPATDLALVSSSIGGTDLLARAIQTGQPTATSATLPAPAFAKLGADQSGIAVPLMITGRAVAVLYADAGGAPAAGNWTEAVEALGRHGSAMVSLRSAMRTLDTLRGDASTPAPVNGGGNGEESARRYARILVSEIKMYHDAAVRAGRQQRDLRQRLRTEIDRAQRLYEERVPPAVSGRDQYFHQELVQTLADGDATLLGT